MRSLAKASLALLGFAAAVAGPLPVGAQTKKPEIEQSKVNALFFHLFVKGEAQSPHDSERWGKAFAVGPELLITSRHVVGDPHEWADQTDGKTEFIRAARPLRRKITLTSRLSGVVTNAFAQPAPSHAIDATGLFVPGLKLDSYLHLSMCQIVEGGLYTALMTTEDPKDADKSINSVGMIELEAMGYEPGKYGPLYVFDTKGDLKFVPEPDGHEGSPILDDDGHVVAIISAVVNEGSAKFRILTTPIQPHFPGTAAMLAHAPDQSTARGRRLSCSLADTVQRIHKKVSEHSIWTVSVKPGSKGYVAKKVFLSYESISARPNITSVDIYPIFYGVDKPFETLSDNPKAEKIGIQLPEGGKITLEEPVEGNGRKFVTEKIGEWGHKLVEPWTRDRDRAKKKGRIDYVQLTIIPFFKNPRRNGQSEPKARPGRRTLVEFPWK